ncbi:MAG: amidase family protein [Flavobacteriales bacterium]|jgi:amidase
MKKLFLLAGAAVLFQCTPPAETTTLIHDEMTIEELHGLYNNGSLTSVAAVQFYLDRIEAINGGEIDLNAVLALNEAAIEEAHRLDSIYAATGEFVGPLHGVPVLLKDNIDYLGMPTTVGTNALRENYPSESSPLAQQLIDAGAIVLGKANLSELANFHSTVSSSGWSPVGGQCKNPYDLSRNPCGSSSGSGAAVAANLCMMAIGTETNGSITCPSNNNGIVGLKPTVGLISRTGIFPISYTQDTGGPMARTVSDVAKSLGTMVAVDEMDGKTNQADRKAHTNYTSFLNDSSLNGKRIGVYSSALNDNFLLQTVWEEALTHLQEQGAELVYLSESIADDATGPSYEVMFYEYRQGVNEYFANNSSAGIQDMSSLYRAIIEDSIEMAYHDHDLLRITENYKPEEKREAYAAALEKARYLSQDRGIDLVMDSLRLDAIVGPAGGPAWKTDHINGDHFSVYSGNAWAISGYPHIVVPMGQVYGLPVGLSIMGRKWDEGNLIGYAYDFEQATMARFTPKYLNSTAP